MPILIKLAIDMVCGGLNALGGFHFLWMRRYIMPFLLAICFSIITHVWWVGIMVLPVITTLSLGYGVFGVGSFSRGCWLFVQAVVVGIGITLTGHLAWFFFVPYAVVAGVLGGTIYNWEQILGDLVFGAWLAVPLFLVK